MFVVQYKLSLDYYRFDYLSYQYNYMVISVGNNPQYPCNFTYIIANISAWILWIIAYTYYYVMNLELPVSVPRTYNSTHMFAVLMFVCLIQIAYTLY